MVEQGIKGSFALAVVLEATEIDLNFNVNVHTDSNGCIIGGFRRTQ
jgi:citrate lyase alpha subunit